MRSGMARTVEVERKYELPLDRAVPELTGLGEPSARQLDATYFDTTTYRLARQRVVLRRRRGGGDAGWHLKRPHGGADARTELREPDAENLPPSLAAQAYAAARGEPLVPVARIRTRRTERPIRGADGTVLAVLADDEVHSEAP